MDLHKNWLDWLKNLNPQQVVCFISVSSVKRNLALLGYRELINFVIYWYISTPCYNFVMA